MSKVRFLGRLAFADAVFEPKAFQGGDKADYNCAGLIDPDTDEGKQAIADIEAATVEVAKAKWGEQSVDVRTKNGTVQKPRYQAVLDELEKNDRLALHDGDKKSTYAGYPGNMFVNMRRDPKDGRPTIRDRDGKTTLVAADGRIYSGCDVKFVAEVWAQDNNFGKRINMQLCGIQFVADNDAFGGGAGPAGDDDFEDLSVDNDDGGDLV